MEDRKMTDDPDDRREGKMGMGQTAELNENTA